MAAKKAGRTGGRQAGEGSRPSAVRPKGVIRAQPAAKLKERKLAQVVRADLPQTAARAGQGPLSSLPPGYAELLEDLKNRIRRAQVRAAVAASRELIRLYWDIGREIVQRQEREGWGAKVIDRLAADLQTAFPGRAGFSRTNIHRARAFYLAYTKELTIVPQAVGQSRPSIVPQLVGQPPDKPEAIVPVPDGVNLPQAASEIPWSHNVILLEKLKDPSQRLWYARKTVQHGWSRAVLVHQIELDLYGREGRAITNFSETLPAPQSDLAQQAIKDPYVFDFLTLADEARDRVTVEYALRDARKPIGDSEYRLTEALPTELKSSLPTIEQLQEELKTPRLRA